MIKLPNRANKHMSNYNTNVNCNMESPNQYRANKHMSNYNTNVNCNMEGDTDSIKEIRWHRFQF